MAPLHGSGAGGEQGNVEEIVEIQLVVPRQELQFSVAEALQKRSCGMLADILTQAADQGMGLGELLGGGDIVVQSLIRVEVTNLFIAAVAKRDEEVAALRVLSPGDALPGLPPLE